MPVNYKLDNLVRDLNSLGQVIRCEDQEIPIREDTFIAKGGMGVVYGNRERVLKFSPLGTYAEDEEKTGQNLQEVKVEYLGKGLLEMYSGEGKSTLFFNDPYDKRALTRVDNEEAALDALKGVEAVVNKNELRFFKIKSGRIYTLCAVLDLERVVGQSYEDVLTSGVPIQPKDYLNFILQCTRARAKIARLGISHGDIKPNNILVQDDQTLKIIDLGLATFNDKKKLLRYKERAVKNGHLLHEEDQGYDTIGGTIHYIAPETLFQKGPWQKSDIYSLGALIHQTLAGKPPFSSENESVYFNHLGELSINQTLANLFYHEIMNNLIQKGYPTDIAVGVAMAIHPDPRKRKDRKLIKAAKKYLLSQGEGLPETIVIEDMKSLPTVGIKQIKSLPPPPVPLELDETLLAEADFFIDKE